MALQVNGEGILQSEYDAQIARLQLALSETGTEMTPEQQKERITSNLIDELLLSQAATAAGFSISDAALQQRINTLINDIGGQVISLTNGCPPTTIQKNPSVMNYGGLSWLPGSGIRSSKAYRRQQIRCMPTNFSIKTWIMHKLR
jgi:hypothetical protein